MLRSVCVALASILGYVAANGADAGQKVLGGGAGPSKRVPNVVFVLTDDQDLHMDSLDYMPLLQKHLLQQGGYPKFVQEGLNSNYLPVWLQEAGYETYYAGKLFNAHTLDNYDDPFPANWTGSDFLLDPYTYAYLNATFQRNREPPKSYEGEYSTDVLAEKAFGFLDDAVTAEKPFFLAIAPVAPHSNIPYLPVEINLNNTKNSTAPISAPRHQHLFKDAVVPRHANFNPDEPTGMNWVRGLPKLSQDNVDYNDHYYRQRLRALQSVDELVEELVFRLEDYGILDNTYIIYTSDNGFHISHHRLQPGKECGFEEDINVPLIIRGPGVPKNEVSEIVTTHTDLVPTIFDVLGIDLHDDFDGTPIPLSRAGLETAKKTRHEHVNVEYWGWAVSEGEWERYFHTNNTYKSLRLLGEGYNFYYSVWCNNVHEFYDLNTDPYQMRNIHPSASHITGIKAPETILGNPLGKVLDRLDSVLMVLKSCKGRQCIYPWETLHPVGDVQNLRDALHPRFDNYYASQVDRIRFDRCEGGYILDAEGPQSVAGYKENYHWSEWV